MHILIITIISVKAKCVNVKGGDGSTRMKDAIRLFTRSLGFIEMRIAHNTLTAVSVCISIVSIIFDFFLLASSANETKNIENNREFVCFGCEL